MHPSLRLESCRLRRLPKWRLKSPPLQVAFLLLAFAILGIAVVSIGELVGTQMSRSITEGIADTTAASMDVMLADELAEAGPGRPLSETARADLDAVFSSANDTRVNPLLQVRLRDLNGALVYQSLAGIVDAGSSAAGLAVARQGNVATTLSDMPLVAVGPATAGTLPVLKLIMPVHDRQTGAVQATAELYFSAANLIGRVGNAQSWAWIIIIVTGVAAIAALFALVDRTGRLIAMQQQHLTDSLAASRRLAGENAQLRRQAVVANERLLAQVGSDLHDGPLQLLAAHILTLSGRARVAARPDLASAQQAMEELRNISAGLVLPELSGLDLRDVIALAVRRHEEMTGAPVTVKLSQLPAQASPDLKVCLFRIVQEGLGNAVRHGVFGTATLAIAVDKGGVTLEIVNGVSEVAIAPAPDDRVRTRLGLDGMRARLKAVGGRLTFERHKAVARLAVYAPL